MAPADPILAASSKGTLTWRPTKIMNMKDLSKDDDFLSHLLVEKLGTGLVPLFVHKMDPTRRLPKTDAQSLMTIVRRLVISKQPLQHAIRQAVDDLLSLTPIRYYLKSYTQKQINAFATHASRYLELYNPHGYIEIAHTSRYSHRTGKSELCILATRTIPPNTVIIELKGSMANLTDEEDRELKRTDLRSSDIRRDFSVIHSKQMKKNHLFLGPARFVNHDCNNNCELFREGRYITFRTLRQIAAGEEITAHYGDGYFGRKNRHCLCETCEKNGRGGYAPENEDNDAQSSSDSDSDSDSSTSDTEREVPTQQVYANVNERRTRRGVYAIVTKKEVDSDSSDEEDDDNIVPLANAQDLPKDGQIELVTEIGTPSDLTSLGTPSDSAHATSSPPALIAPTTDTSTSPSRSVSMPSSTADTPSRRGRSSCSMRRTGAAERAISTQIATPTPPSSADPKTLLGASTPMKRITRSTSALDLSKQRQNKGKEKAIANSTSRSTSTSRAGTVKRDDIRVKKEEAEPRSLRTRPSVGNIADLNKEHAAKAEVPRGPDGKPLPLCITCSNILPVISVDSKIVWGLGLECSPRRRKKIKQECPRCMRHAAIYGRPWPCRIPLQGSAFLPTPHEEAVSAESTSGKMSQKALSVLDRKLKAAALATSSAKSRKHEREEETEEGRRKKRKMESRHTEMAQVHNRLKTGSEQALSVLEPPAQEKRKRGRPRLNRPPVVLEVAEPPPRDGEDKTISQPRNPHGRFEKKSDNSKDVEVEQEGARTAIRTSPRRKRAGDGVELEELPNKRSYRRPSTTETPTPRRVVPRAGWNFHGGGLTANPNPLRFARHAWGHVVVEESSGDESVIAGPVTPEDILSPPATTIVEADAPMTSLPCGALTLKPSPFAFAKRRWSSTSTIPDVTEECDDDDLNQSQLRHKYPKSLPKQLHRPSYPLSFPHHEPPNFVRAGWDSCSSESDS